MYKPTQAQRDFLSSLVEVNPVDRNLIETRSNKMREWYIKGQNAFRRGMNDLRQLNDATAEMDQHEKEGFLMGWQADAWAYDNDKPFAVSGGTRWEPDDMEGAHGYSQ